MNNLGGTHMAVDIERTVALVLVMVSHGLLWGCGILALTAPPPPGLIIRSLSDV